MTPNSEIEEQLLQEIERVENSIIPLHRIGEQNEPELFGSGVLIRVSKSYFIFSASHVIEEIEGKTLYVPMSGDFYPINGIPTLSDWRNTKFDFGILHLSRKTRPHIDTRYFPLSLNDCIINHRVPFQRLNYVIFGFPASQSKARVPKKHVINKLKAIEVFSSDASTYPIVQAEQRLHIVVDFPKKFDRNQKTFEVTGMSGGGLFLIIIKPHSIEAKLAGIMIKHGKPQQFDKTYPIVSIRTDAFTSLLRKKFPVLNNRIPQSKLINVK